MLFLVSCGQQVLYKSRGRTVNKRYLSSDRAEVIAWQVVRFRGNDNLLYSFSTRVQGSSLPSYNQSRDHTCNSDRQLLTAAIAILTQFKHLLNFFWNLL
jgi:hypothetical protein